MMSETRRAAQPAPSTDLQLSLSRPRLALAEQLARALEDEPALEGDRGMAERERSDDHEGWFGG